MRNVNSRIVLLLTLLLWPVLLRAEQAVDASAAPLSTAAQESAFAAARALPRHLVFEDAGSLDWSEHWFLDGEIGTVSNSAEGMELRAGPEVGNNAHHVVLWTKDSFSGDVCIEYEYTRLDAEIEVDPVV